MMALLAQKQLLGYVSPGPRNRSSKQLPALLCGGWGLASVGPEPGGVYFPFCGLGGSLLAPSCLGSGHLHPPLDSCGRQQSGRGCPLICIIALSPE